MSFVNDLTGKVFARLTVLRWIGNTPAGASTWECRCACGNLSVVCGFKLTQGRTKSCGCLRRDHAITHGMSHHGKSIPEYGIWAAMVQRCTNPKNQHFDRYGGRGITVCDRWRYDFAAFLEDMGRRPSVKHTIERKDNDSAYNPENCCWATRLEQASNRVSNVYIEWNGLTLTISEWSRRLGIHKATLRFRLRRWSVEDAFTTSASFKNRKRGKSKNQPT